jgi:hypothetical protein
MRKYMGRNAFDIDRLESVLRHQKERSKAYFKTYMRKPKAK